MSDKIDAGLDYLRDKSDKLDEIANDFAEELNNLYEENEHLKRQMQEAVDDARLAKIEIEKLKSTIEDLEYAASCAQDEVFELHAALDGER